MSHTARGHTGHRIGEHHGRAKITDAQVREMRQLRASGYTYARLAERFGGTVSGAWYICNYWTRWCA